MILPDNVIMALKDLVHQLVIGNYEGLQADGRIGRLTAEELHDAISEYGGTLTAPPDEAFDSVEVYVIEGQENTWAIELELWTAEEGESDLTLSATVSVVGRDALIEIDDLHVL